MTASSTDCGTCARARLFNNELDQIVCDKMRRFPIRGHGPSDCPEYKSADAVTRDERAWCPCEVSVVGSNSFCAIWDRWTNCRQWWHCVKERFDRHKPKQMSLFDFDDDEEEMEEDGEMEEDW